MRMKARGTVVLVEGITPPARLHAHHHLTPDHPGFEIHSCDGRSFRTVWLAGGGGADDACSRLLRLRLPLPPGLRSPSARMAAPGLRGDGDDARI